MQVIDLERDLNPALRPSGEWRSSWENLETVMPSLIERFHVERESALDLGVERGYSTAVLAQLFREVTGVDHFLGDQHAGFHLLYYETLERLRQWPNITLIRDAYQYFIREPRPQYDLIHIDLEHTYEVTYDAGRWAAEHANVVIFHDTEIGYPVKEAIQAIADETERDCWNYPHYCGLGILTRKE